MRLIRRPEMRRRLGDMSRSSEYRQLDDGLLPPPIEDGALRLYLEHEVDALVAAMVRGDSREQRRALVREQVVERASAGRQRNPTPTTEDA